MLVLDGIKVLDLTHVAPGAFCTMVLGDLGAEVLKIEAPRESGARFLGTGRAPVGEKARREAVYYALNRNKKSLGLNLRAEEGRQIFYRLAEKADVIMEGFRPGVVKRLGVDYEVIKGINPRIVYCSLSGYGQDGPYQQLPGHDINYISIGGALGLIGKHNTPPVIPLNLVGDFAGGALFSVIGILAALLAREKIGRGQYVDVAMTDGVVSLMTWFAGRYFSSGTAAKRGETALHGAYPYYGVYETKDGKFISIGCIEHWFWENLCRVLGREDFIPLHFEGSHFLHKPEGEKWEEVSSYLKQAFLTKTRDEWFELLSQHNVPIAKVYTLDEALSDPQVCHRQMVVEVDHPTLGKVKQIASAIKLSETPPKIRSLSPLFGEHTDEVLSELGYDKEKIKSLREAGVVG